MYAVIQAQNSALPTVINMNDKNYPDYLLSGAEVIETGTKRDMQEVYETLINDLANLD